MEAATVVAKRPHCLYWSEVEKWTPTSSHLRFGKLPDGWHLLPVSNFAAQIDNREKVEPNGEYRMAGVKWYGEGIFLRETVLGSEQSANYLYPLKPGCIIYNRLFAWKESFAVVPEEMDGFYVSNEFPQFEVDQTIALPRYVYLLFVTRKVIGAVNAASIGSAAISRNRFKESDFLGFKVPIPPLHLQQKIVEYWEAASLKAAEETAASEQLAKRTPSLLVSKLGLKALVGPHSRPAFVSSWQEIERWGVGLAREMSRRPDIEMSPFPIVSLSDVIGDLQNGWSPKCLARSAEGDEWGVLKVGAVSFGWFDESQNKALPPDLAPREQYEVKSGDLIISRANIARYVGACALVERVRPRLMLCDKLFRVVWKEESPVLPRYLNEILKIPHLRWQIENNLTGASPTMKNISKPALMALRFPLPPLDIQEDIISEIEQKRKEARQLLDEANASRQSARLE